jgi:pimeloyl-ACP methyl ester carboxylesterase
MVMQNQREYGTEVIMALCHNALSKDYFFNNEPTTCSIKAQVSFTALLTTPLSFFMTQVAIAQSDILRFCLWNCFACILGSFPVLVAFFNQEINKNQGIEKTLEMPWEFESLNCGNLQTSIWRGWRINHTHIINAESTVPVILIHGFGGSIGHWRQNISEIAKHHNVYAIDLLGFGASDKPEVPYSVELWVEQIYDFWKEYVNVPAVLVGNSIGSLVCLSTAAMYPEAVSGVAMISLPDLSSPKESAPSFIRPFVSKLQSAIVSPWVLKPLFYFLRQPWVVRQWATMAYACKEAVTDELLEILVRPALEQDSVKAFCAILKAMINPKFSPNIRQILGKLQMPSLLLWGKQDRLIPITLAWQFLSYNSNLELVELDNAGHCAHDDRPEHVNWELLHWIRAKVL